MRILLVAAILISGACLGQSQQKTIAVQGKSKIMVKPDIAIITFSLKKTDTSQSRAMAKTNELLDQLSKTLSTFSVTAQQLKISDYRIETEEGANNRKKEYRVSNSLIATIRLNGKQINEILKNIEAQKMNGVDVSFNYELSDSLEKQGRIQATQNAIINAKTNAENISKALNIQLKSILSVSKNGIQQAPPPQFESVKFTVPIIKGDTDIRYNSAFDKYDVEDKEIIEEILIVFEITS